MLCLASPHLITCEVLYWALITRPPALRWCSEIYSHAMDCCWSVTIPLPLQVVQVTVWTHLRVALWQQPYSMHPLMSKQLRLVLSSSLPRLTTFRPMPRLLPLAPRPGSSIILTRRSEEHTSELQSRL